MPTAATGGVTIIILVLTWCINLLFGVLIARATYRAMIRHDTTEYLKVVILNDSLERIRSAIIGEMVGWSGV
jgi:hypothetical protein